MIEGVNSTFENFEDVIESGGYIKDISTVSEVIQKLEERRKNVLNGGTNCIPLPFVHFRNEVPGIEQGQYVVCTANQKVIF